MNMCISIKLAEFKLMNIKPNFSELSRQLGVDRHTLKKHFDAGGIKPRKKKEYQNQLDKYKEIIEEKLEIKEFKGNIIESIKEAISYIQNHISFKSNIVGIQREELPEIPLRAIREIVVNSFAHCSYARVGDYNQYVIYKSSVRIYNPGSIIKGIDPISFASGKVGSKIRNLLIASTLYKYGYIDAFELALIELLHYAVKIMLSTNILKMSLVLHLYSIEKLVS